MESNGFRPEVKENVINFKINTKTEASDYHMGKNEDRVFSDDKKGIIAVFDGMGGQVNGDRASQICLEEVEKGVQFFPKNISVEKAKESIFTILDKANKSIREESHTSGEMGSTAIIGISCKENGVDKFLVANLGDSRAYLFRDGKLNPITIDDGIISHKFGYTDSKTMELQNKFSEISDPETQLDDYEKILFEKRHMISAGAGVLENINPKFYTIDLKTNDKILFCSDGITDNLRNSEIEKILKSNNDSNKVVEEAKSVMRDKNNKRRKSDDASAAIIDFSNLNYTDTDTKVEVKIVDEIDGFKTGQTVNIKRSNGRIDDDFRIVSIIENKKLVVGKGDMESDDYVSKIVTVDELKEVNKNINSVSEAESFNDLKRYFSKINGLQGSSSFYESSELLRLIDKCSKGELNTDFITRTGGLRDKVIELISKKK